MAWFITIFLGFLALAFITSFIPETKRFIHNRIRQQTRISRPEFIFIDRLLCDRMTYYAALDIKGRARFVNRLVAIREQKSFKGMEDLEVTDEMRILISATIAQITFGLNEYAITHFHTFLIYPHQFHSRLFRQDMLGGTMPNGVIMLSWSDYQQGYAIDDDGRNLGLHELAHGLKLNLFHGSEFDAHFAKHMDDWLEEGKKEFSKMKNGEKSWLRTYAGTNMHEFFSVCVENFFEKPRDFNRHLPDLYSQLCVLLNQDPLRPGNNYLLAKGYAVKIEKQARAMPRPPVAKPEKKYYGEMHWTFKMILAGLFLGFIVGFPLYTITAISSKMFWSVALILAAVGFLAHFAAIRKENYLPISFFLIFIGIGFVPTGFVVSLAFNYVTSKTMSEKQEQVLIIGYRRSGHDFILRLEGGHEEYHQHVRTMDNSRYFRLRRATPQHAIFTYRQGWLGWKVVSRTDVD
ncbi:MAG: zinc-dependent peptidase [Flavobacteriales bacterium]|nr:zinc-dependent peptidase [Flavobacteriales bacterium]